MPPRDYWWTCQRCALQFEHLDPYLTYTYWNGKRRRVINAVCARQHEADYPGHRCSRRTAPAV